MGRRKTLAEELEELASSAPIQEHDPEEDVLGGEAALEETDDELSAPPRKSAKVGEGKRLRAALHLDSKEYAGRATSRLAAFGGDGENGWHEAAGGLDDDFEEDEAAVAGQRGERGSSPTPRSGPDEAVPPLDTTEGGEDAEMAALEAEFAAAAAADAEAVDALRERAARERARGLALRNQRAVWDAVLELRILLQRCLQAANRLPHAEWHAVASAATPELRSGYGGFADACGATLGSLLELQGALVAQHPGAAAAAAACSQSAPAIGAGADSIYGAGSSGALWARLEAAHAAVAPFRDAALDRWHRKALLAAGGGAQRGALKALDQAISAQVAALMRDPVRARARSQLLRAQALRPLCQPPSDLDSAPAHEAAEAEAAGGAEERVPESYDDAEFYQQLLKEFLEGSAAAGARVQSLSQGGKKRRKQVDRRASKGRKLRYHVHEKLVNFVAPRTPVTEPAFATQLFANLFGRQAG